MTDGRCIQIQSTALNTELKNTLLYNEGGTVLDLYSDGGVNTTIQSNLEALTNPFVSSSPQSLTDFWLDASSFAIDAGENLPAEPINYPAALGPLDGDGDGTSDLDAGAYEYESHVPDFDGDGIPDVIDPDDDNDGAPDDVENLHGTDPFDKTDT